MISYTIYLNFQFTDQLTRTSTSIRREAKLTYKKMYRIDAINDRYLHQKIRPFFLNSNREKNAFPHNCSLKTDRMKKKG